MTRTTTSWPARPTLYNGIQMRSRLEATWAGFFDANDVDWSYEPMCFADESGQYLPDFLLRGSGQHFYVELKPYIDERLSIWQSQMEIIWASEPDAVLVVASPDTSYVAYPNTEWRRAGQVVQ